MLWSDCASQCRAWTWKRGAEVMLGAEDGGEPGSSFDGLGQDEGRFDGREARLCCRYVGMELDGPGRIRTYDQGIHLAPAFPPGVDYLFTRARTVRVGAGCS